MRATKRKKLAVPKRMTKAWLTRNHACQFSIDQFVKQFPSGVQFNALMLRTHGYGFNIAWLLEKFNINHPRAPHYAYGWNRQDIIFKYLQIETLIAGLKLK